MKNTIVAILLVAFAAAAYGGDRKNEVSVEISGGISSISYCSDFGSVKPGAGTSVGINYLRNFNKNWGLGTGLNFRLYQSSINSDMYSDTCWTSLPSGANRDFRLNYLYTNFKETQKAYYLSIPVFAQYRHDCGFYARLGAQLNIPVGGKSIISYGMLRTTGYFPYENVTITDIPSHGFGAYFDREAEETLKYRVNGSLYAEVGWNWNWNDKNTLYVGINGECGLGSVYKRNASSPQLIHDENGNFGYTPVWDSNIYEYPVLDIKDEDYKTKKENLQKEIENDATGERYKNWRKGVTSGRFTNYSVGIVLRYSFGW